MDTQWSRFLIWLFSGWMLFSGEAMANSYDKGAKAFRNEEYARAYKILSAVAKKSKDKSEKAEALALMGAASAKLGKKNKAESLFNKALKQDSDVDLPSDIVKDKGVRKLFAKVRKKSGGSGSDDDFGSDTASKSGGGGSLTPFIPLGIGYFLSGDYTKGLLYGGAQAAGIVGYLYFKNEIDKANADADVVGQEALSRTQKGEKIEPEIIDFLNQNEAFVKTAQRNQLLMMVVAVSGYSLGAIDGYLFGSSKSVKKSKRRVENLLPAPALSASAREHTGTSIDATEEAPRLWDMKLHFVPRNDPGLMLSINKKF